MKKITMVKEGFADVILIQGEYSDGSRYYIVETQGVTLSLSGALALNNAYRQYIDSEYQVLPDAPKKAEPKLSAPKEQKPQKTPTWDFGEGGFDRQKYLEIAKANNWTWCDPRGRIHVLKAHRKEVYLLMGGKKN